MTWNVSKRLLPGTPSSWDGKHSNHSLKELCQTDAILYLSTRPDTLCPGAEIFPSLEEALKHCEQDEQIYIIGGASVYRQALPLADALCLTEIDAEAPQADAYFPEVSPEIWQEKSRESHPIDEKHPCPYAFVNYIRR